MEHQALGPSQFLPVDDEGAGQEFDLVAEGVEGDGAREVGEVTEHNGSEGDGELGAIEADGDRGVCEGFSLEDDAEVPDPEPGRVDGQGGGAVLDAGEGNGPGPATGPQPLVETEEGDVSEDAEGEDQGGESEGAAGLPGRGFGTHRRGEPPREAGGLSRVWGPLSNEKGWVDWALRGSGRVV